MNFTGTGISIEHLQRTCFKVRDRVEDSIIRAFKANRAQRRFLHECQKLADQRRKQRWISVKCRRVGFSRQIEAIGLGYMTAYANLQARIMAHKDDTAEDMMQSAGLMASGLPIRPRIRYDPSKEIKRILINHPIGASLLTRATAGSPGTGRGRAFGFVHFSEAAHYPLNAPFTAMLPTVATSIDRSFVSIESTANGKVGKGEKFHSYWEGASWPDDRGDSDFVRFFVPYTENPWCVHDPTELDPPIPCDDEEKILVAAKVPLENIAWRRVSIATEYAGLVEEFNQENPLRPEDAFIASGFPAFSHEERVYVEQSIKAPRYRGDFVRNEFDRERVKFITDAHGKWLIWEMPKAYHEYYIGADAARGIDVDRPDSPPGDYAAVIVWDGTTGEQVAGLQSRLTPAELADNLDMAGRYFRTPELGDYHFAWMMIELTGNLGLEAQRRLREDYAYPRMRFAPWRGKDDRVRRTRSLAIGWETTGRTREMMFAALRTAINEKSIIIYWNVLAEQIQGATMHDSCWEVKKGHDDVLVAAMIGWMARVQNVPKHIEEREVEPLSTTEHDWPVAVNRDIHEALAVEWDEMFKRPSKDPLAGIAAPPSAILGW